MTVIASEAKQSLSPFLLEDACNAHESSGLLNISSGTFPALSLNDLLEHYSAETRSRRLADLLNCKLNYGEAYGSRVLRELISSKLYSDSVAAADVFLTAGASEAIYILFTLLANPDATFIVQKPIYQSLYSLARDRGAQIIDWNYSAELSPDENIDRLELLLGGREKITGLILCNPSNPLGVQLDETALKRISALLSARDDKPLLIVDEVFRSSSMIPTPSALDFYERAIVISDLSKSFSLPGLRLGWLATRDTELLKCALRLKNYLSLRINPLDEGIAMLALDQADQITKRNRDIAVTNFAYLCAQKDLPFEFARENIGAPVIYPLLKQELRGDIFVLRADIFEDDSARFRLGFGLEPECFKRIIDTQLTQLVS